MGIQDLGAIGEFVSSIVITVTLVLLVLETRSSRKATLQGNRQLRQQIQNALHLGFARNPLLSEALVKANAHLSPGFGRGYETLARRWGLTPGEYVMVIQQLRAEFRYFEDQFFTELPDSDRRTLDAHFITHIRGPAWNEFWNEQRPFFHADFREYVDDLIATSGVSIGNVPDDFDERIRDARDSVPPASTT
jgi:hypothetical protein